METKKISIEEGNRLIAEFMGASFGSSTISDYANHELPYSVKKIIRYHKNWNLLMPVVEKIEAIENSDDYEVDIFGNCCDIGGKFEVATKTKIQATWQAVIQFILWYNSQSKQTSI